MNSSIGLTTSNRFSSLVNNSKSPSTSAIATKSPKPNVPPIVITNMDFLAIRQLLEAANVDKSRYFIKYMSVGTKILLRNCDDYKNTLSELNKNKTPFFTHDIPSEKTTKFVLSGLHDMPPEEIKCALNESKIVCHDIKKMRTKNKDQCLFLVYFPLKAITINDLKNIKSILSVVVKWTPYIASKKGPTQCNNCQLYGHGNRNCHLLPRCLMCAGQHTKANCPSVNDVNFIPKCSLCGDSHVSNDPNCPKKAEYIAMRKSTSQRYRPPNASVSADNLRQQRSVEANSLITPQPRALSSQTTPKPSTSQVTTATTTNTNQTSYSRIVSEQPIGKNNEELFSAEELINLTMELIHNLSNCKTKSEQFQVVSNLAFKFVYPHHGP